MYNSICLQVTNKCNFECSHCYLSCGPFKNDIMSDEVIETTLNKLGSKAKKIWISGGVASESSGLTTNPGWKKIPLWVSGE